MVKAPILPKTKNISQSETCFFMFFGQKMDFFTLFKAKIEKILKKFAEKFGGKEKSRTFAARLRNNGNKSSLKRLKESTRSKYREYNKIYREALISLEIMKCQYQARNL